MTTKLSTTTEQTPLPDGWRWARLGEVCEFLDSRRIPVNDAERAKRIAGKKQSELFPYYGANGQVGWIDDYIFDEPLILLAEDGGYFGSEDKPIAYAVSGRYWVNNHAHVLKPRSEVVDFDYCLHALRIRPDVGNLVSGSTRAKLNQEIASGIAVPLPPFPEQRRIAARLNGIIAEIARARAAAQAALDTANVLPAALLRTVFESDKAKGWEKYNLGELTLIDPTNGIFKRREEFGRGAPLVNVSDLFRGREIDLSAVERVEASADELKRYDVQPGDLFFCRSSVKREGVGWCSYVRDVREPTVFDSHVMRLRLDPAKAFFEYVAHYWAHPDVREKVISNSRTATMTTMNQGDLTKVLIPLPSVSEQKTIAVRLNNQMDEVSEVVTAAQAELDAINALPAMYLRRAFRGEL